MPGPERAVPRRQNRLETRRGPLRPLGHDAVAPNEPNWPGSRWAREIRNAELEIRNKLEMPMIETREIRNEANPNRSARQTKPISRAPIATPSPQRAKQTQFPRSQPENRGRVEEQSQSPGQPPSNHDRMTGELWD